MEQRVSLVTLGITDLARSRQFYTSLGWRPATSPADDVVFFQAGGMVLGLWDRAMLAHDSAVQDSGGWGGVTLAYNVRSASEVDAAIEEARAAGAVIAREPSQTFWGGYSACSSTRTGTRGKWRTIPAGHCSTMAASAFQRDARRWLQTANLAGCWGCVTRPSGASPLPTSPRRC